MKPISHAHVIANAQLRLFDNPILSDVKIHYRYDDTGVWWWHAHRAVLCRVAGYFSDKLLNMKPAQDILEVDGRHLDVNLSNVLFGTVLKFLYLHHDLEEGALDCVKLAIAAEQFELPDLLKAAENAFTRSSDIGLATIKECVDHWYGISADDSGTPMGNNIAMAILRRGRSSPRPETKPRQPPFSLAEFKDHIDTYPQFAVDLLLQLVSLEEN